jgi:CubicO group peptidase (beta-lactamase class C family)
MKKTVVTLITLLLLIGLAFYLFLYPRLEVISGYNAKVMCSCSFITGLSEKKIEEEELGFSVLWLASNKIDREKQQVHSSVWGMHPKTAVYREGLGCSLVNDRDPAEVEKMKLDKNIINYDSAIWPKQQVKADGKLQEAIDYAFSDPGENPARTRAVVVVKDGQLIAEAYADGISPTTPLHGWSMSKSITSTFAGILAKEGYWNLNSALPVEKWEDGRSAITLKNALQMSSGLHWEEDYGKVSNATIMLYGSDNMGAYAASQELEFEPGKNWEYSSGTTNIIAKAMEGAFPSLEEYQSAIYKKLFAPLGARSFVFETDASGHFAGSSYGYASARDWAKVGLLYLNNGHWQGQQVIDSSWVAFSHAPAPASDGEYGGHFWLNLPLRAQGQAGRASKFSNYSQDAYWMGGFQGQQVSIHPSENLVIVRLGVTYNDEDFDFDKWVGMVKKAVGSGN